MELLSLNRSRPGEFSFATLPWVRGADYFFRWRKKRDGGTELASGLRKAKTLGGDGSAPRGWTGLLAWGAFRSLGEINVS